MYLDWRGAGCQARCPFPVTSSPGSLAATSTDRPTVANPPTPCLRQCMNTPYSGTFVGALKEPPGPQARMHDPGLTFPLGPELLSEKEKERRRHDVADSVDAFGRPKAGFPIVRPRYPGTLAAPFSSLAGEVLRSGTGAPMGGRNQQPDFTPLARLTSTENEVGLDPRRGGRGMNYLVHGMEEGGLTLIADDDCHGVTAPRWCGLLCT
jgi:hypothetical protein